MAIRGSSQLRQQQHSSRTLNCSMKFLLTSILVASSSSTVTAYLLPSRIPTTIRYSDEYLPQPSSSSTSRYSPSISFLNFRRTITKRYSDSGNNVGSEFSKAPTFDGKMVFPIKALTAGLAGHKVAAVYAVMGKRYKRGSENDWQYCEHIGFTRDLNGDLQSHIETYGPRVAHVRALSFAYPQKSAMMEVASRWKEQVSQVGGNGEWVDTVDDEDEDEDEDELVKEEERRRQQMIDLMLENAAYDDDDDEFEFDDEVGDFVYPSSTTGTKEVAEVEVAEVEVAEVEVAEVEVTSDEETDEVISPFANNDDVAPAEDIMSNTPTEKLIFSLETVDKILDDVRPYLISDGGNVSIQSVDMDTKNVYLVLEGACGSCASSTVTMQMGIERVLRENFDDLGDVIQVENPVADVGNDTELTLEAVQAEVQRVGPAISAMGGVVEILKVDPIGVVELSFRGPNRVQHGLELAIRDLPFVKHVKFVN